MCDGVRVVVGGGEDGDGDDVDISDCHGITDGDYQSDRGC